MQPQDHVSFKQRQTHRLPQFSRVSGPIHKLFTCMSRSSLPSTVEYPYTERIRENFPTLRNFIPRLQSAKIPRHTLSSDYSGTATGSQRLFESALRLANHPLSKKYRKSENMGTRHNLKSENIAASSIFPTRLFGKKLE